MGQKGILTIISGFSGAGKGTLIKELLSKYHEYALSISATTRHPRQGETNGVDYFFMSTADFVNKINTNGFVEYARYVDNYYGTPRAYVEEQLSAGRDLILEIEMQGALRVKKAYPEALMLFIVPPSASVLLERLSGRGTEDPQTIQKRLQRAKEEAEYMPMYEYIIENDSLSACVEKIHSVIQNKRFTVAYCQDNIQRLSNELSELAEGRSF